MSLIVAGATAGLFFAYALSTADWNNRDDLVFTLVVTTIFACLTIGIILVSWRYSQRSDRFVVVTPDERANLRAVAMLLGIGGIGYAAYAADWSFVRGQIADYVVECAALIDASGRCNGPYIRGPVTVYTVNASQQVVVGQTDGGAPVRLSKCAVVDRQNWKCDEIDGEPTPVAYAGGVYKLTRGEPFVKHVLRFQWLWADQARRQSLNK